MPIYDPCALLHRLCQEPNEVSWLEFKQNNADPQEIGEYISALANSAMLAEKDRAYLVFGVEDGSRNKVGTTVRLTNMKKGGEDFQNWIARLLEPHLLVEMVDFQCDDANFSIICIEPSYDRPVKFSGAEYIRLGQNKRRLSDFPQHERSIWLMTGRRKFENAIALSNQSAANVLQKLNSEPMYELTGLPRPRGEEEVLRKMIDRGFVIDNLDGHFDITNLGAILLANDVTTFPSISRKSVRIIKYAGKDKTRTELEQTGSKGYATGFVGMMKFLMSRLPAEEKYESGVRKVIAVYPETAIREVIANALIHQDFTITGAGPVIEIYDNRVEIINPGNSLIDTDRIFDERRSRNEELARAMRDFGICEERGGGLDKTLLAIEEQRKLDACGAVWT
jgi:ATP-dependent DNA helicase RecG